jgi:hypothetical protein
MGRLERATRRFFAIKLDAAIGEPLCKSKCGRHHIKILK